MSDDLELLDIEPAKSPEDRFKKWENEMLYKLTVHNIDTGKVGIAPVIQDQETTGRVPGGQYEYVYRDNDGNPVGLLRVKRMNVVAGGVGGVWQSSEVVNPKDRGKGYGGELLDHAPHAVAKIIRNVDGQSGGTFTMANVIMAPEGSENHRKMKTALEKRGYQPSNDSSGGVVYQRQFRIDNPDSRLDEVRNVSLLRSNRRQP